MRAAPSRTALPLSLFKQVVDGGGSALNAQEIRAALDAKPTLGSVNVEIELTASTSLAQARNPSPSRGSTLCITASTSTMHVAVAHVLLQQHFQVGQGQRVATSTLRALWRDEDQFETLVTELKPKNVCTVLLKKTLFFLGTFKIKSRSSMIGIGAKPPIS